MKRSENGFTLIELVVVIGIIAVLSVMIVGGFSGILRAMGQSSAAEGVRRAMMLARQTACVDGVHTFFWATDIDKFVIVRAAGTVSATDSNARKPSYYYKSTSSGPDGTPVRWILDEYADTGAASASSVAGLSNNTSYSEDDKKTLEKYVKKFREVQIFDMTTRARTTVVFPAWFSDNDDAWVTGIDKKNINASDFKAGNAYGLVMLPEQTLTKGYVFDGSYNSSGDLNERWLEKAYIHFGPDGSVLGSGCDRTFTISEVTTQKKTEIKMQNDGKVLIK